MPKKNHTTLRSRTCRGALLLILLTRGGLASAQVCVDPAGGGCQPTIQAGVDVATAGQTITVASGTYSEAVEIPPGKDGLVIEASAAVLDNPSDIDGISILSNDVRIRGLAFRNGNRGILIGDARLVFPSGTMLSGLSMAGVNEECVVMDGADHTTITRSTFLSCGASAVRARTGRDRGGSDNLVITKNRFRVCDEDCIDVEGDDAVITGNRIAQGKNGDGITIEGDHARVRNNFLVQVSGGLWVEGRHPEVVKNTVSAYAHREAYHVECTGDCDGALVVSNRATNGVYGIDGFQLHAAVGGMVVSRNSSARSAGAGFEIHGQGMILTRNRSTSSGSHPSESGFIVQGVDHVLTGNVATRSANDGFSIRGTGHLVSGNAASENSGDGFDVDDLDAQLPVGIALTDNVATDNVGFGFNVATTQAGPIDLTLTGNSASGNHGDFCASVDTGSVADGGGNSFTIAGAPACDIDRDY